MSDRTQSIETNEHIRAQVLELLKDEPKTFNELFDGIDTIEERQQLSNALFHLKSKGTVVQLEDKRYALAENAKTAQHPMKKEKPPKPPRHKRAAAAAPKPPATPAAPNGGKTTLILETLMADAQHALDEYIYSVGDKQILDQLAAARDAARAALKAHNEKGVAK